MAIRISSLNHCLSAASTGKLDDIHLRERRWFAVRTSSRHEKRACEELRRSGVECYVPLREKVYKYPGKKVTRQLPLMSGYVFVRIHKGEEMTVRRAHYVSGFVTIGEDRRMISEHEIDLLRKLSTDRKLDWDTIEEAFDFREGTPVEIIRGPLAGIRGYYVRKKSKKTFVISLSGIGACLSTCEIDPCYLMTLSEEAMVPEEVATTNDSKVLW
ncbi:UpxY family transcription antiterminator [Neolewinella agarilytica]|uniref:Transcription antitermination protein nusG n=1 Tax=Neolewinella agarilytica TaxID=478744 RepID=A0A1H9DX58_9BACT|nr:UpxY family transcription antiterminator [Neolewinella agarilytica]SEQ18016.1 transcription antitermination protein nusG [Neolewinella agarilytica]